MSKLMTLYKAIKSVKEMKSIDAVATGEMSCGDAVVGTVNGSMICKDGKCSKQLEAKMGERTIKFGVDGCCSDVDCCKGEQCCTDDVCCKGYGKLNHAMMMLKLLDRLEEKTDEKGQKSLVLELNQNDMPSGFRAHMSSHMGHCFKHISKKGCCVETCCADLDMSTIMPTNLRVEMLLNETGAPTEMLVAAVASSKLKSGADNEIRVRLNVKLV